SLALVVAAQEEQQLVPVRVEEEPQQNFSLAGLRFGRLALATEDLLRVLVEPELVESRAQVAPHVALSHAGSLVLQDLVDRDADGSSLERLKRAHEGKGRFATVVVLVELDFVGRSIGHRSGRERECCSRRESLATLRARRACRPWRGTRG